MTTSLARTEIFWLLLLWAGPLLAQNAALASALEKIGPLRLHGIGATELLEPLERWTGKTLIRSPSLPNASVNLNLGTEVTKVEAVHAVESLLALHGIGIIPVGEHFLKAVPLAQAKAETTEVVASSLSGRAASGQFATKAFELKFLRAADCAQQITPFLNQAGGAVVVFDKTNAVVVTDTIANLQRIEGLLRQMDRAGLARGQPSFRPLRFARAGEVAARIKAMLSASLEAQLGQGPVIEADERTNQIVLFAAPAQKELVETLIQQMDVRSGEDVRHEVVFLKHTTSKDIAAFLNSLVSSQGSAVGKLIPDVAQEGLRGRPRADAPAAGPPAAGPESHTRTAGRFSALVSVLAEERGNALLILGTDNDVRLLTDLVGEIDRPLAQVRVEVVIAEVGLSDNSTTGIGELGLKLEGDRLVGFSGQLAGLVAANGLIGRRPGGHRDLAAELTVLTTPRKSTTRLLSMPAVVTTHNHEGRIFIGEQRPIINSYLIENNSGGGSGYRSTVVAKEIGLLFSVRPLIGADDAVQMAIKLEVDDVLGEVLIDGNSQPRIGRRTTETFINAWSGDVVVLGGLQRTTQTGSNTRLGPLPILGDLLGTRSRSQVRTDLVLFLRPQVIRSGPPSDTTPK